MSDPIGRAEWRRHPRPGEFEPLPVTSSTSQPEPCPMAPYAPQRASLPRSVAEEAVRPVPLAQQRQAPPAPEQQDDEVVERVVGRLREITTDYETRAWSDEDWRSVARDVIALASRRPTEADQ